MHTEDSFDLKRLIEYWLPNHAMWADERPESSEDEMTMPSDYN